MGERLLVGWPYKRVPCLEWMEFRDGDRVRHLAGPVGTVRGYDFHAPGFFYVQWDDMDMPSRIPSSSLTKED